jgi:uncharacterized Zn-binding protein involved in type VI secretion
MATNALTPFWDNGDTLTCHAAAAMFGKRFVAVTSAPTEGNITVNYPAAGGSKTFGVTGYDVAVNGKVTVWHQPAIILPVTAGAQLGAGDLVTSDAQGRAVPAGTGQQILGLCLAPATANSDAMIDRSVRG